MAEKMDIKTLASNWDNVQAELAAAITAFVEDLSRIIGSNRLDSIQCLEHSPIISRMEQLFEYGIHGRWNDDWEDVLEDDAISFVEDLDGFRVVSENSGEYGQTKLPLSRYVVNCAVARFNYDNGNGMLLGADRELFFGFSASDLAYLSGLDERTIRNQMGTKGSLSTVTRDNRAYVAYNDGVRWLRARGFKETEIIGAEFRDLERRPFRDYHDLAEFLTALQRKSHRDDALVQTMIAGATDQTLTFDLDQAIDVARCLSLKPKPFISALIELIADEQRRKVNQRIAEKGLDG
jgi:hypothetical protein